MPKIKAKTKSTLPPFVVTKHQPPVWFVRRVFPTNDHYPNGKRKYVEICRRCVPETESRARELAVAIENEFKRARAEAPLSDKLTLAEFFTKFFKAKKGSIEQKTLEFYQEHYDRCLKKTAFVKKPIADIKPLDVQLFYAQLGAVHSPVTVGKLHTILTMAFNQAVKWETIDKNPCKAVIRPKPKRPDIAAMTREQAKAFLAAAREDGTNIVFEFALETFMRPGEYLALRWKDVDLDRNTVRVQRSVVHTLKGGGFKFKDPKTTNSKRTIEISPELKARLVTHMEQQALFVRELRQIIKAPLLLSHLKAKGVNYEKRKVRRKLAKRTLTDLAEYDLVFPASNGLPMSPNNLGQRYFKPLLARAKIDPDAFDLYSLRHSGVTLALLAGADIKTISEKAGHSDVALTLSRYASVLPAMRSDATEKLAKMLYGD